MRIALARQTMRGGDDVGAVLPSDNEATALCSLADLHDQDGTVREARLALGGVATIPWRAREAEDLLKGQKFDDALASGAAEAAFKDAKYRQWTS